LHVLNECESNCCTHFLFGVVLALVSSLVSQVSDLLDHMLDASVEGGKVAHAACCLLPAACCLLPAACCMLYLVVIGGYALLMQYAMYCRAWSYDGLA
jgi:hypothetical protein